MGYSITRIVYKLLNNKLIAVAIERRASRHKQLSTLINHFWPKWATLFANELRVRPFLVKTNRSMDQLGAANWSSCQLAKTSQICQNAGGKIRHKTQRQINMKTFKKKKQIKNILKIAQNVIKIVDTRRQRYKVSIGFFSHSLPSVYKQQFLAGKI